MAERSAGKVRIGVGLGSHTSSDPARFEALIDGLEALGFDSLWLSERVSTGPDPLTALAYAAARTDRLKLGTAVTILPGRNPMLLAKQIATLDRLSSGRMLPAFGLGVARKSEQQAFGVPADERGSRFDEALPLLRRFWSEDKVDHKGKWFRYEQASVQPQPLQQPIPVWLGGSAPSELQRCGRLGDGWLPSFTPPEDVAKGIPEIKKAADKADRSIDDDHYGALVPYVEGEDIPDRVMALARRRKSAVEPTDVIGRGLKGLRSLLERYIEAGASKFVVVPVIEPTNWDDHVSELADAVHPLEA
ncbi:MAG TPA: LLM class flavin-dependent oxidoreductase [Acidimicrobiales bacterium]|jgi:probable F420-dependent oxidoreductase